MITDLCGFISLSVTLVDVYASCAGGDLDSSYKSYNLEVSMGPGYYCYLVCLFGAMLRAVFHWVTPLPGRGSGCSPRIPASLLKRLDLYQDIDKDPKKVSWDELKKSYKKLVKIHHEERRERELSKSVIVDQPKDGSSSPPPSSRPNSKDDFPGSMRTSKDTFGYIISAGNNNSSNSKASSNETQLEAIRGKPLTQRAPSLDDDIPVASPAN
jgi:hypothetical protein